MQSINPPLDSSSFTPVPREAVATSNYEWILCPPIDILFACGGMTWILWFMMEQLGIMRGLDNAPGAVVWVSWVAAVHLFANDHVFLGWHRVATSKYVSAQARKNLGLLGLFFCIMTIPICLNRDWAILLVKIYMLGLIQHFVAQAYGVSMLYCLKRNYKMSKAESTIMRWMFRLLTISVITRGLTYREYGNTEFFEGLKLPFWGPLPEAVFLTTLYAFIGSILLFAGMVVRKYIREKLVFPLPALLATSSIIGLFYVTLSYKEPMVGLIMTGLYHGSQNFVVALACHLKERGLPDNVPTSKIYCMLFKPYTITYCICIVIGGVLLAVVLPRALTLLSVPLQITLATVFALQGFHHFITESVVWRLRHPEVRKILVA